MFHLFSINQLNFTKLRFQTVMYSSTITQYEEPPKKKADEEASEPTPLPCKEEGEQPLIWRNILGIAVLHVLAFYSFFTRSHEAKLGTWIFSKSYILNIEFPASCTEFVMKHRKIAKCHRFYPTSIILTLLSCFV